MNQVSTSQSVFVPEIFQEGYERARKVNPALAVLYIEHTMVGDPQADAAVKALEPLGHRESNRLIQAGAEGNHEVLQEAPQEVRDLFSSLMDPNNGPHGKPLDPELAHIASLAFHRELDVFLISLVGRGFIDGLSTLIGKSFLSTGYTTTSSVQRMRQSLRQMVECFFPGGLVEGDARRLTARARLVHAQARQNMLNQGTWDINYYGTPVSAAHVGYATAAFSALTLQGADRMGLKVSRIEREAYMHVWRYIAWMMGMPDTIPVDTEKDAVEYARVGRICEPIPEVDSIIMAHTSINSTSRILGYEGEDTRELWASYGFKVSRALIGNDLADHLDFPDDSTRGVLAAIRWKRRFDRLMRRQSSTTNFMALLDATETIDAGRINYTLPDHRDF